VSTFYERLLWESESGAFARELVAVEVPGRKGAVTVAIDEQPGNAMPEKMLGLKGLSFFTNSFEIHNTGGASYFINVIDLTLPNTPANNREWWAAKLASNVERDRHTDGYLRGKCHHVDLGCGHHRAHRPELPARGSARLPRLRPGLHTLAAASVEHRTTTSDRCDRVVAPAR